MHDSFKALLPLLIPEGVSDYFEMTHYSKDEQRLDIFLEEMNIIQQEYTANKLIFKGFSHLWTSGLLTCQTTHVA